MGAMQTQPWSAAAYLRTEEDMIAYFNAVLAESDPELTVAALNDIAQAQGKTDLGTEAGLTTDEMSNSNNPELTSVLKMLNALGLRLQVSLASTT